MEIKQTELLGSDVYQLSSYIYLYERKLKFHFVELTDRLIQNKIAIIWTEAQGQVVE